MVITLLPLGFSPDSSRPSTVPNGRTKPPSAKLLTRSHKLALLLQGAFMAERISGTTDKRSEIKNGPIGRQAALTAHQVKCKRIQGSTTNARSTGLDAEKAAWDTSHVHVDEWLVKPEDRHHHHASRVRTYAGQALQVMA